MSTATLNDRQKQRLIETLLELADQHLPPGYAAIDSDLTFEFGNWMIRLDVEGRGFRISLDECADLSRLLVPHIEQLAELDTLPYMIEIGSPGLFRQIKTEREITFYKGWAIALILMDDAGEPPAASADLPIQTGYLVGATPDVWQIAAQPFEGDAPPDSVVAVVKAQFPTLQVTLNPPVAWPADDDDLDDCVDDDLDDDVDREDPDEPGHFVTV